METKILTPIQLWQEFKPVADNFNINIINYQATDNMNIYELYFTSFAEKDGDLRVFTKVYFPKNKKNNSVVILIDEFNKTYDINSISYFLQAGNTVVTFDYKGISKNKHFTHYPNSIKYGNIIYSGEHFDTCKFGAENTCLFLWCKIARQVISFVKYTSSLFGQSKIFMASRNSGANILWQVAGTDNRLDGIIPINNTGFDKFNGNTDSDIRNLSISELAERNVWSLCCASPSYAKFIECPVLFLGASNNTLYSFSTLSDTLKLIPEGVDHYECISMGCSKNLYKQALYTALNWIDEISNDQKTVIPPKGSFSANENKLWVHADFDTDYDDIVYAEMFVAYGNDSDSTKNWIGYNVGVTLSGNASQKIKVYDINEPVHLVCVVYYRNGSMYTSPLTTIIPATLSNDIKTNTRNNRIIYDKKYGVNTFFPRENSYYTSKENIHFKNGALDISGITTNKGSLVCYNVNGFNAKNTDVLLQFDCFTLEARTIKIEVQDINMTTYYAILNLNGSDEWQNIKIDKTAFMSENMFPLKSWENIKILAFCDAENVLFNNIIWI